MWKFVNFHEDSLETANVRWPIFLKCKFSLNVKSRYVYASLAYISYSNYVCSTLQHYMSTRVRVVWLLNNTHSLLTQHTIGDLVFLQHGTLHAHVSSTQCGVNKICSKMPIAWYNAFTFFTPTPLIYPSENSSSRIGNFASRRRPIRTLGRSSAAVGRPFHGRVECCSWRQWSSSHVILLLCVLYVVQRHRIGFPYKVQQAARMFSTDTNFWT